MTGEHAGRVRQHLVISRTTGDAEYRAEVLPAAGFADRTRELKASLPDIGPVEARFAVVVCDGCGVRAELDFDAPALPDGWRERPDGDFCPACLGVFYVLVCRLCGDPAKPLPMPFESPAERGKWAAAHTAATGHDSWFVIDQAEDGP